jgi:hypothetical protein
MTGRGDTRKFVEGKSARARGRRGGGGSTGRLSVVSSQTEILEPVIL